ncbi:LuxR family transcriptional regulator [Sphingobium sp. PNB]|jgi:DNA-binding CsgD family transcriptional regulator|uniref:helix-turn-helix transcriptional regulator n=1 Tax=unclassified Sphingobium TaxID=2611147 RepID=UPI001CA42F1F|nr:MULTISPECIES: LuxR family transcriptional regulator [unclassified Sphingobium]MCB4861766.1 LuxR family transcriptional regulator [Sphingobium sp. PNB]
MANRIKDCGRLDDLTRFATECARAENLGELHGTIDAAAREFGFRWFTLLHNVDLRRGGEQALFLTTYPSAWLEEVLEERHYLEDPIHAACARTPSGLAWDRIGDVLELTPRQRSILERARDHDLASGYSLPIRTPGEPEAIFTAARSRDEPLSAEEILTARLLGSVAYDRARELLGEAAKTLTCVPLSPRQVECIALVAQGKSDWEIGQILGLSRDTVHEYVESARRRYGVRRRTQLVLRAVRDGHLNMEALL